MKISVCTLLNVENVSSRRNSFGLGSHFCQQNKLISVKKIKRIDSFAPSAKLSIVSRILRVLNIR